MQENQTYEGKQIEELNSNTFQETKRRAYDEYLVNLVQKSLNEKERLVNIKDANQYDYITFSEELLFFDFEIMRDSIDHEFLIPLSFADGIKIENYDDLVNRYKSFKKVKNKQQTPENQDKRDFVKKFEEMQSFKSMNNISKHLDNILKEHFIMIDIIKNIIVIGDKNKLKLPSIALTMNKEIKAEVFGMIISKDNQKISDDFSEGEDLQSKQMMPKLGTFPLESYLINFFGLKNNSEIKIIHPISIEYSAD